MRAWRLARHRLLEPAPAGSLERTAAEVGGIHAQLMSAAEVSLATRVDGAEAEDVRAALWERRTLVKTWCMRGTLHLLPAHEWPLWSAALAHRTGWRSRPWLKHFGVTIEELEAWIEALAAGLDGEGKTREEVAALAPASASVNARMGKWVRRIMLAAPVSC